MSAALRVLACGAGVTLQDEGRHGYLRFGVSAAGPMDPIAHATANLAAGNAPGACAIEISQGGLALTAEREAIAVAVAGGAFTVTLDGVSLPSALIATVEPGATLQIGAGKSGVWCYLAPAGEIAVEPVLGSRATHARSHIGGFDGRPLAAGDVLHVRGSRALEPHLAAIDAPGLAQTIQEVRVMLGPQADYFDESVIAEFLEGPWTVSVRSDRMGYRLDGPRVRHKAGFDIVSDGIALGAIQVPGEGVPIVLMADRQTTGGYPKIATVVSADIGRFAQLRPGSPFRFRAVTHDEALAAQRAARAPLAQPPAFRAIAKMPRAQALLGANLIDGATAGEDY